jgi:hypothetical protein
MTPKEQLLQAIESAPESLIEEVLTFLQSRSAHLLETHQPPANSTDVSASEVPPIWEIFAQSAQNLPEEALAELPTDGAAQIDHYLYGSPKRPE